MSPCLSKKPKKRLKNYVGTYRTNYITHYFDYRVFNDRLLLAVRFKNITPMVLLDVFFDFIANTIT